MRLLTVTVSRADYGYLKPLLETFQNDDRFENVLVATGTHLEKRYGETWREIRADGHSVHYRLRCCSNSDRPRSVVESSAELMKKLGGVLRKENPDGLIILGDRFETLAVAFAASSFLVPVIHLSGGDITEGALDDMYRHAVTKLSHLHYPSNPKSAERIKQMGEESWRVYVVGSLSLETLKNCPRISRTEFFSRMQLDPQKELVTVTFHPPTLDHTRSGLYAENLVRALESIDANIVITAPNNDPGSSEIVRVFKRFVERNPNAVFVKSLGMVNYTAALRFSIMLVGNSSSGLTETPLFRIPTVNIGDRQKNRLAPENVIHCGYETDSIRRSMKKAKSRRFRENLKTMKNPYDRGSPSRKILAHLHKTYERKTRKELVTKKFIPVKNNRED